VIAFCCLAIDLRPSEPGLRNCLSESVINLFILLHPGENINCSGSLQPARSSPSFRLRLQGSFPGGQSAEGHLNIGSLKFCSFEGLA